MYIPIVGLCLGVALVAASPDRSLLAIVGALLFAASAIALLVLFVVSVARSIRSRSLHGGQLLAGGILLLLVLFVVQRLDGPSPEAKIERTIGKAMTGTDPDICEGLMTERYLEQSTGEEMPFADDACANEIGHGGTESVEVSRIEIDDGSATALVANRGGSLDGSRFVVRLREEGGGWKLDRMVRFDLFDRAGFRRAYREKLAKVDFPARAANCILARELRFPDAAIEREALEPDFRVFAGLVVGCARASVERNLVGSIADPALGFSPRAVECGRRRLARASDAELMRVQLYVSAYTKLLLACDRAAFLDFHRRELADDLDPAAAECVVGSLGALPNDGMIRLAYDQERYEALIDECEGA